MKRRRTRWAQSYCGRPDTTRSRWRIFSRKLGSEGGSGPQFLSDHPNPGNRKTAIQKEISGWPARHYSGDSTEFAPVRKHAARFKRIARRKSPRAQRVANGRLKTKKMELYFRVHLPLRTAHGATSSVPFVSISKCDPARISETADLGALKIDRPENWEVVGSQQSSATIAPRAGVSGGAVAYGAVIRAGRAPAANLTMDQLTAAIVQSLRSSDSNMKQVGDIQPITVDGISGGSVELETISPMADCGWQAAARARLAGGCAARSDGCDLPRIRVAAFQL